MFIVVLEYTVLGRPDASPKSAIQLHSQLQQSTADTRLGGTQRHAQRVSHLLVRQLIQERQRHGFALQLGQNLEGAPDGRATLIPYQLIRHFRSVICHPLEKHTIRVRIELRTRPPVSQLVHDAAARDLDDPRLEAAAPRVEAARALPNREKDILDDFLRGRTVQSSCSQACEKWPVAFVQGVECFTAAFGEPPDQLFISNMLCVNHVHERKPKDGRSRRHRLKPSFLVVTPQCVWGISLTSLARRLSRGRPGMAPSDWADAIQPATARVSAIMLGPRPAPCNPLGNWHHGGPRR